MNYQRVTVGAIYQFCPTLMDLTSGNTAGIKAGTLVRVVEQRRAGVGGKMPAPFCWIEHLDGTFIGMACRNSLQPLKGAQVQMNALVDERAHRPTRGQVVNVGTRGCSVRVPGVVGLFECQWGAYGYGWEIVEKASE